LSQIKTSPVRPQLGGLVIPCFSLCLCLCLCLSQIKTSPVRPQLGGLVIPCFSLCLCLCLCLSQIKTSPVRPQLGGLVIPCFGLCLCCLCQPTASRTRVALLLRSATMRRKYGCGFACAVSSRRNPNQLGAGEGSHPFLGVCRNLQAGRRS
jgi:hypothetical protein